jgi:hypothetical protein
MYCKCFPENLPPSQHRVNFLMNAEDSLLFWLNKCYSTFVKRLRVAPTADAVLTSLRDVGDGRCLASAISFYRPNDLPADGN